MTDAIKPGDVVTLKSGGPSMTVNYAGTADDRRCTCLWFIGSDLKTGDFYPEALKPAAPKASALGWVG